MEKQEAIKKLEETVGAYLLSGRADDTRCGEWREILETLRKDNACKDEKWIPVSVKTPEELTPVNITWVNRNPESYYKDIKDKPFSATGVYYKGKWYWYSAICEDMLAEYGRNEVDEIDADIEITAWMPLPEPYKSEVSE